MSNTPSYIETMLEHLPVGVALFDAYNLRLLATNACFQSFLDPLWPQERAIGHTLTEFFPQAERSGSASIFREVATTGIPYHNDEYLSESFPGGTTYWNWTLSPIPDCNGAIIQLLLTISEITSQVVARQQAERMNAALSQKNRQIETERQRLAAIETLTQSIRGTLQQEQIARAAIATLAGYIQPPLLAIYTADTTQRAFHILAPNLSQAQEAPGYLPHHIPYDNSSFLLQTLQQRAPFFTNVPQTEQINHREEVDPVVTLSRTQSVLCVPLWFQEQCEGFLVAAFEGPREFEDNEVQILMGCSTPLVEALVHARFSVVAQQERQRLYTILDQLPEGILLVEATTSMISYANATAAHLLGIPLTQLIGLPLNKSAQTSSSHAWDHQLMMRWNFALIHALEGETIRSQELLLIRPDGREAIILSSAAPLRTAAGIITEAVIVFQDITTQKGLEQQKNEFFTVANHELRTPLTVILGFTELLQLHPIEGADDMQQYAITSIIQEGEHLYQLIHEMLDVVHLEHAPLDIQKTYQDLLHPLTRMIKKYTYISEKHHLHLKLEELEATGRLMGWFDQTRIEQILSNLINNAIKYSPAGGDIEIGMHPSYDSHAVAQEVLVWVKDQGTGIPASSIDHIFERFYRADKMDRSISGFGIGLYVTREIVQGHGGRIWVESTEGQGSTFFVALPLQARDGGSVI